MTLEARLDMPTEETKLLQEEDASVESSTRVKKVAAGMLCSFAALAMMSGATSEKPIPKSLQDFRDHMPVWSFLLLVLLHSLREVIAGGSWEMGPALKLYTFALPYAIAVGAATGNNWAALTVQVAVIVGVVATVLDQLRAETQAGLLRILNAVAFAGLVVGTAGVVIDRSNNWSDSLPFIGWAATAISGVYIVLLKDVKTVNDQLWLLVLYTAANAGSAGGSNLSATLMKVGCIGGAVYSVVVALDVLGEKVQKIVYAVTQAAIFVPLCWNTIRYLDLDHIWKEIAAVSFAVILGLRAVLQLLFVFASGSDPSDKTDLFVWIFVLCLVLQMRALLDGAGSSTKFSEYAGDMAQVGPAIGLVALILTLFFSSGDEGLTKILRHVAELVTILGILLA